MIKNKHTNRVVSNLSIITIILFMFSVIEQAVSATKIVAIIRTVLIGLIVVIFMMMNLFVLMIRIVITTIPTVTPMY